MEDKTYILASKKDGTISEEIAKPMGRQRSLFDCLVAKAKNLLPHPAAIQAQEGSENRKTRWKLF
jgi:hypothetical protein